MPLLALFGCTGGDSRSPHHDPPPPTDIVWPEDTRIVDVHVIGPPAVPVDMLVAVDPDAVARAAFEDVLPLMISALHAADPGWRVGVTSTALGTGESGTLAPTGADGGRWLSAEDLDQLTIDWDEFPATPPLGAIGATWLTITTDPFGFRRPDATLHLVVMSDEPDATPASLIEFEEWTSWVAEQGAIVSATTYETTDLAGVVTESGGIRADPTLEDLHTWATNVGSLPRAAPQSYALSRLPHTETIELTVETPEGAFFEFFEAVGDPPVGDFLYLPSANAVAFLRYVPDSESTVYVTYEPRE